jgi:hypothetical protein
MTIESRNASIMAGEQEAGADRSHRRRQNLQPLEADEGEARGAGRRCSGASADHWSLRQRDRLKLNCRLLPDFELPQRTLARSDLEQLFHLKHRETRDLTAGAVEASPGVRQRRDRKNAPAALLFASRGF